MPKAGEWENQHLALPVQLQRKAVSFMSLPLCSKAGCFKQMDILLVLQNLRAFTLGGLEIRSPGTNISLAFFAIQCAAGLKVKPELPSYS